MIEQYYGEGVFFEDAFEIAFPDAYSAALKENNIIAVSRPENVDILSIEPSKTRQRFIQSRKLSSVIIRDLPLRLTRLK